MSPPRPWAASLAIGALGLVPPVVEGAFTRGPAVVRPCTSARSPCGTVQHIDVAGAAVHLHGMQGRFGGTTVHVGEIAVRPTWTGLAVELRNVALHPAPPREHGQAARKDPLSSAPPAPSEQATPQPPWERIGRALRGIPLVVAIPETLAWESHGTRLRVHRTQATWDADGALEVRTEVDVRRGRTWGSSVGPLRLRPADGNGAWNLAGTVTLGGQTRVHLEALGHLQAFHAQAQTPEGGRLDLRRTPQGWHLHADAFPLAGVGPLGGLELQRATLTGTAELQRRDGWTARVEGGLLRQARVRDRRLAQGAVELAPLGFDGTVEWQGRQRAGVSGTLRHGRASLDVALERRADHWTLNADLAPLPCQDLWDDLPEALTDAVPGVELAGEIAGRVRLDVVFPMPVATDAPEGTLDVALPVLERCRVTRDPSTVDFAALSGPYRLAFVDGLGRARVRTLAPGAPGYRSLDAVPRLAAAFIALEDAKFWSHDGFDREQIERALWHNLRERRISRGASTITQQTARSLFLGIDRSVARKLQEAFLAARLEALVSKRRILEIYLNVIELAPGVHGVEDAAWFYFGRPADELNVLEALHLAAMAPAPHRSSERFASGEIDAPWRADLRRHARRMARQGALTPDALRAALRAPVRLLQRRPLP